MRCLACNAALSDSESTRKSLLTHEYLDLCDHCFNTISSDVGVIERLDLIWEYDDERMTDEDPM